MTENNEPQGHWSNGDPVHFIIGGPENRIVAPNLNGATWIPGRDENTEYINEGEAKQ